MRRRLRFQRGFTLLEVMIALSILFATLVILIRITSLNVRAAGKAKLLTAATQLARGKMLDIEEELRHEGFQDTAEEMDGDFDDEGFPKFKWEAKIEKVELPALGDMQNALGDLGLGGGEEGEGGGGGGILGSLGGATGDLGAASLSSAGGMGMLLAFWDVLSNVLENAIRKVTLTVSWKNGSRDENLVVVLYLTEPKAIDQALGGFGGLAGGAGGAGGGGDSGGGGSPGGGGVNR